MKSKGKAITLLSILCVVLAFFCVMSFIRFPAGVKDYNGTLGAAKFDYDLDGGIAFTYTLADDSEEVDDIDQVVDTLGDRLDALGYKAYSVKTIKEAGVENAAYDIRLEVRNTESVEDDISAVMAYGTVKFLGGTTKDTTEEILTKESAIKNAKYVGETAMEGRTIHQVALQFTDYGYDTLKELVNGVADGEQYYLKIMLGDNVIMNASAISLEGIKDKTVYLTQSSESQANQTALQLKTGGLQYKYELVSSEQISPMLGDNALMYTLIIAGSVIVLAIVASFIAHKGYGFMSMVSLFFYVVLELGMMVAVPGIVVSLYGVIGMVAGGLITALGLSLTASKIKNEFECGRTLKAAVRAGYRRSFYPVLTACIIAGVIGLVTFIFAGGAIQSFGITLGIGAVVAFLAVEVVSRMFIEVCMPLIQAPEKFIGVKKEAK